MFVKKDLRKIPVIFNDAMNVNNKNNDDGKEEKTETPKTQTPPLTELRLARRPTEFKGSIQNILCQPHYIPALRNLMSISLYDCNIHNLDGIGFFASQVSVPVSIPVVDDKDGDGDGNGDVQMHDIMDTNTATNTTSNVCCPFLEELNLGRNPIKTIPSELGLLSKSLKRLWLDDCQLKGSLPDCLYELDNLETLRLSNNQITELKDCSHDDGVGVSRWSKLQVLCLDGNDIETIPAAFVSLTKLESLLLRKNKLTSLPEGVPGKTHTNLKLLHLSSNQLSSLPNSMNQCKALKTIYANGNNIQQLPNDAFLNHLKNLESCNLSNNGIHLLSKEFLERFGQPHATSGECKKDPNCTIFLEQNPVVKEMHQINSQAS